MNALILAAGYGTRLAPLTDVVPKPLVQLVDAKVIDRHIQALKAIGVRKIFVNTHHLATQISDHVQQHVEGIEVQCHYEPKILGTAGPLAKVFQESTEDLLVVNADIVHQYDLADFVQQSQKKDAFVSLMVRDYAPVNTLFVENEYLSGLKGRFGAQEGAAKTFCGISWYSAKALEQIPAAEKDIRKFWQEHQSKISCVEVPQNLPWIDMGTPEGLFRAVKLRLEELEVTSWPKGCPICPEGGVRVLNETLSANEIFLNSCEEYSDFILLPGAEAPQIQSNAILGPQNICWKVAHV